MSLVTRLERDTALLILDVRGPEEFRSSQVLSDI
jgi:hypothetical protein